MEHLLDSWNWHKVEMWQKHHPAAMHKVYWETAMFREVSWCDKATNLQNDGAYLFSGESNAVKPK